MTTEKQLKYWESLEGRPSSVLGKHWKLSDKSRENIAKGHVGINTWTKGKPGPKTAFKKGDERITGSNNPNWKGGVTSQNKLERVRFQHTIQKQVFKRDNYQCQMCGSNKDLQVDHIQSWADYIELRFSIDNCRTLCAECHYKITFGKPMPVNTKGWGHHILKARVLQ